jgi:hypothetical protein
VAVDVLAQNIVSSESVEPRNWFEALRPGKLQSRLDAQHSNLDECGEVAQLD